jgi:hypothetical protein
MKPVAYISGQLFSPHSNMKADRQTEREADWYLALSLVPSSLRGSRMHFAPRCRKAQTEREKREEEEEVGKSRTELSLARSPHSQFRVHS